MAESSRTTYQRSRLQAEGVYCDWVQLHNIPEERLLHSTILQIVEVFREFHGYDPYAVTLFAGGRPFVCVDVTLDLWKPLPAGTMHRDDRGEDVWIEFRYDQWFGIWIGMRILRRLIIHFFLLLIDCAVERFPTMFVAPHLDISATRLPRDVFGPSLVSSSSVVVLFLV
ncbi:hypothetical protein Tsubulata_012192 [Turnera subulata]|uniref:Uncharacterized protein n=1 Tax=Turnera subulata TaxID=218843 RepID=A0A9Q0J0S5_9ROSI|nr:hypothetical protein Tsubulata_012192 [Turnera subulata]